MILRVYHARVYAGQEAEFERLFRADALPQMRRQPGLISIQVGRGLEGAPEFIILSRWRDLDALRPYAGEGWQAPPSLHPAAGVPEEASVEHYLDIDV